MSENIELAIRDIVEELKSVNFNLEKINETASKTPIKLSFIESCIDDLRTSVSERLNNLRN